MRVATRLLLSCLADADHTDTAIHYRNFHEEKIPLLQAEKRLAALDRYVAGLASGVWESVDDIALLRQSDRIFKPEMDADQAKQYHDNWLRAVGRAEKWSLE